MYYLYLFSIYLIFSYLILFAFCFFAFPLHLDLGFLLSSLSSFFSSWRKMNLWTHPTNSFGMLRYGNGPAFSARTTLESGYVCTTSSRQESGLETGVHPVDSMMRTSSLLNSAGICSDALNLKTSCDDNWSPLSSSTWSDAKSIEFATFAGSLPDGSSE